MGFLNELGKAFMGKPLGPAGSGDTQSSQSNQPTPANTSQAGNGILNERGLKIIPDIDVRNLKSYLQGDKLIVKAWVFNESPDQIIRVDTSYLLKQKRTHNQEINPKNSREITLYDGPAPTNENERQAQIAYRLKANGDVFMESYRIDYGLESDGKRIIEELHDDGPIRDI
jgi:hypothetical protein